VRVEIVGVMGVGCRMWLDDSGFVGLLRELS